MKNSKFEMLNFTNSDLEASVRVENLSVLRFANYIFVFGRYSSSREFRPQIKLETRDGLFSPEYVFEKISSRLNDPVGEKVGRHEIEFVATFWINDIYSYKIGNYGVFHPFRRANVCKLKMYEGDTQIGCQNITEFIDWNYDELYSRVADFKISDIYENRVFLEVAKEGGEQEKEKYIGHAFRHCGIIELEAIVKFLYSFESRSSAVRKMYLLLGKYLSLTPLIYASKELVESFLDLSGGRNLFKVSVEDAPFFYDILVELGEQALGADLITAKIQENRDDRAVLATLLKEILPPHTKWWVYNIFNNKYIGNEQVADAMNNLAVAAHHANDLEVARIYYALSLSLSPSDAVGSFLNAGWLALERGDSYNAEQIFQSVERGYGSLTFAHKWPEFSGKPWPYEPIPEALFADLTNKELPRISVVTPSYQQGEYIEETILSVLNQNYPNLQYIIIDGGSTDETLEVVEKYKDRIDIVVSEPDNGQSHAINKGFAQADGELVAWLNSDDMYCPGALHMAAKAYLETGAQLISGSCVEHSAHEIKTVNKPQSPSEAFSDVNLSDIFEKWFHGHFFYQPETFFSRELLKEAGYINETLHYAMDYDLWMRFAQLGCKLEVTGWPFAFFRKHENQKTNNEIDCIEEQAEVRDRYVVKEPDRNRRLEIQTKLSRFQTRSNKKIIVISARAEKIFARNSNVDFLASDDVPYSFELTSRASNVDLSKAALIVKLIHLQDDVDEIKKIREENPDVAIVGWFWDNHHHPFVNYQVSENLEVTVPGHNIYSRYLKNTHSLQLDSLALCTTQWSKTESELWYQEVGDLQRSTDLFGGFVDYGYTDRTKFLNELMASLKDHALTLLDERQLYKYFDKSEHERFREWCGYCTSLVLPLRKDLSQRVFDALLAGQIPLVPEEIADLDLVIPRELQRELPIVRFSEYTVEDVTKAHRIAVKKFIEGGAEQAGKRHEYALRNHMFVSRMHHLADLLLK